MEIVIRKVNTKGDFFFKIKKMRELKLENEIVCVWKCEGTTIQ